MKLTELKKLIREEVRGVIKENKVNESNLPSSANRVAKQAFDNGDYMMIDQLKSQKLKVDNGLLGIYNGMFYHIVKVKGSGKNTTYVIADESFGDEEEKKPEDLQNNFLLEK